MTYCIPCQQKWDDYIKKTKDITGGSYTPSEQELMMRKMRGFSGQTGLLREITRDKQRVPMVGNMPKDLQSFGNVKQNTRTDINRNEFDVITTKNAFNKLGDAKQLPSAESCSYESDKDYYNSLIHNLPKTNHAPLDGGYDEQKTKLLHRQSN